MAIRAISFDLGNTLAPYNDPEDLGISRRLAAWMARSAGSVDEDAFYRAHREEREKDLADARRTGRENDLGARIRRVLTRLGAADEDALVAGAIDAVRAAFSDLVRIPPPVAGFLKRLGRRYRLAVVSNYLLVEPIHDVLRAAGLEGAIGATVVSRGVGRVKPEPEPFLAAARGLGVAPQEMVHVGDDWRADIIGAGRLWIRPIYTRQFRVWPDPAYPSDGGSRVPEIRGLSEIEGLLEAEGDGDPWGGMGGRRAVSQGERDATRD
ncbi:MAG: HAD family hydrolase [Planctomycetes bacterium]|nr:HAD family hydrolase [Planctomycetota bacterium]